MHPHFIFIWFADNYWRRARTLFFAYCRSYRRRYKKFGFFLFFITYWLLFYDFITTLPGVVLSKEMELRTGIFRWFRRIVFNLRFSRRLHRKLWRRFNRFHLQELFGTLFFKNSSPGFVSHDEIWASAESQVASEWGFRYCERSSNAGLMLNPIPTSILAHIFHNRWVWFRTFGEFFSWLKWRR